MWLYYILTIVISILFVYNKKWSFYGLIISGFFLTIFAGDFPPDYDVYKGHFDTAYFTHDFPFFKSTRDVGFEALYSLYSSLFGVILKTKFNWYLCFNFIISIILLLSVLNKYVIKRYVYYLCMLIIPVILPTIFLFSPRSSLSFVFLFCGYIYIINHRSLAATVCVLIGVMLHAQYLPLGLLLLITYLLYKLNVNNDKIFYYAAITICAVVCFLVLLNIQEIYNGLGTTFYIFQNSVIAEKLLHFERYRNVGFRLTSLLSLIIHPVCTYYLSQYVEKGNKLDFLKNKENSSIFIYMTSALVIYAVVINLTFYNSYFLAGRLSRFADYLGFLVLIPLTFSTINKLKLLDFLIVALTVLAPILYPTLYLSSIQ